MKYSLMVVLFIFVHLLSCRDGDMSHNKKSLAERRIEIFSSKLTLIADLSEDSKSRGDEKITNLIGADLLGEIESLNTWFSNPRVMILGGKKDSVGLPESETCARIRGMVSEMRMAFDGYAESLPSESTFNQRIHAISELAKECKEHVSSYNAINY